MSVNRHYILILFFIIITPFVFMINRYLFIGMIVLELILMTYKVIGFGNKLAILFLYAVIFSGISIAGLKIYDWIIFFAVCIFFLTKRGEISVPTRIIPFLLFVLLNAIIHYTGNAVIMESLRYVICILLIVITIKSEFNFGETLNELICIGLANLYFAVMIYIFMHAGKIIRQERVITLINGDIVQRIQENDFVSVELYVYSKETRLGGFFSDPNKYMVFCFALLVILEIFVPESKKKKILSSIVLISAIFSLSRTALIIVALYIALKILYRIKEKQKKTFYIIVCFSTFVAVILILMPEIINEIVNYLYVLSSEIMGRTRALELSTTLQGDNRTLIWQMALNYIWKRPLLGHGWLSNEYLLPYPTHNSVLELLLDGGLVALAVYVYMFWPLIRYKRWDIIFSCYLISSLMLDLASYRVWYFLLGLILCKNISYNAEMDITSKDRIVL